MIRRISKLDIVNHKVASFIKTLKSTRFTGDVDDSYSTRISLATDNSIYQAVPQAAIFPKTTDDLVQLTQLANRFEYQGIKFAPRGGGTGTNGQSLSDFVIVDLSRHMRGILEIEHISRLVTQQDDFLGCETGQNP